MMLTSPRFVGNGRATLEACLNGTRTMPPNNGQDIETDKEAVRMVQRALVDLGYLPTYSEVDGIFGPKTGNAVSRFKLDRQLLPADGVIGRKTSAALDAEFQSRPTNLGQFATFVTDNRLDADIADLLNELRGFTFLTWTGQVADFALHELSNHNLVGIVRLGNIQKLKDQLDSQHHAQVDNAATTLLASNPITGPFAVTTRFEQPNWIRGFIIFRNEFLDRSIPGDERHIGAMLVLAHELTHFRNRVLSRDLLAEPVNSTNYVNPSLAQTINLMDGSETSQRMRQLFIEEIGCRHVAWRVHQDLVAVHAQRQISSGIIVRPGALGDLSSNLSTGRFFRAVLKFAEDGAQPNVAYDDNGYMLNLLGPPRSDDFNRQVGLWLGSVARMLFHDDPVKNNEVRNLIISEIDAVRPVFSTPNVIPSGLINV